MPIALYRTRHPGRFTTTGTFLATLAVASVAIPLSDAWAGAEGKVSAAELDGYLRIYVYAIPLDTNTNGSSPNYDLDESSASIPIERVGYFLQLDERWVWTSMIAFTQEFADLGVPHTVTWDTDVENMNVESNDAGIVTGTDI